MTRKFYRNKPVHALAFRLLGYLVCGWVLFGAGWAIGNDEDYRRFEANGITIFARSANQELARSILNRLHDDGEKIARFLGIRTISPVTVILMHSDSEFRQVTGGTLPEWSAGAAHASSGTIFVKTSAGSGSPEEVALHEMTHILTARASMNQPLPVWFEEGIAQVCADERVWTGMMTFAEKIARDQVLWFDELEWLQTFPRSRAEWGYQTAYSAVDYLRTEFGEACIPDLLSRIGRGQNFGEAFTAVTGVTVAVFENQWYEGMKQRYRWAVLMDAPALIGSMMGLLFVTGFARTVWRTRRKRLEWEKREAEEAEETAAASD